MLKFAELVDELATVKEQGYILTHRPGNTGVGKTLEDQLGIKENNIAGPNGFDTELKAGRKGTSSMLTLFTKAPLPPRINMQLLNQFGKIIDNKKSLHTTINAQSKNTLYGKPGFKISVRQPSIEICHDEYKDMVTPYWNRIDLEKAFNKKYPKHLLYVKADCLGRGKLEKFHYNEAWLMSGFHFDHFVELLETGKILVDIRIGRYPNGKIHDHGTEFRVKPDKLELCFSKQEKVI